MLSPDYYDANLIGVFSISIMAYHEKNIDQIIQKNYMSNIFRDVVFVLAAAPNRLSKDKIIFSENHISHCLCLVL